MPSNVNNLNTSILNYFLILLKLSFKYLLKAPVYITDPQQPYSYPVSYNAGTGYVSTYKQ